VLATFACCHQKHSNGEVIELLANKGGYVVDIPHPLSPILLTGVNINKVNKNGYSALSIAAANGNLPLVTTLMHYGL